MARGWGKSEEDLQAEREQAREASRARGKRPVEETRRLTKRRSLALALASIEEQLPKVHNANRRRALETARAELLQSIERLAPDAGKNENPR